MLEHAGPRTRSMSTLDRRSFLGGGVGVSRTEGSRGTNDDTLALDLLGQIDLVAGRVLDQHVKVWDGITLLHKGRRGVVEERGLGAHAWDVGCESTGGEHDGQQLSGWKRERWW